MRIGDQVEKLQGYKWPGEIVSLFKTKNGDQRVVVECTSPDVLGEMRVFRPSELLVVRTVEEAKPMTHEEALAIVMKGRRCTKEQAERLLKRFETQRDVRARAVS